HHNMLHLNISSSTANYTLSLHDALPISIRAPATAPYNGLEKDGRSIPATRCNAESMSPAATSSPRSGLARSVQSPDGNDYSSPRSEEHTSELQSRENLVCRLLLEKKKDD